LDLPLDSGIIHVEMRGPGKFGKNLQCWNEDEKFFGCECRVEFLCTSDIGEKMCAMGTTIVCES